MSHKIFAIGDPQASYAKFHAVLAANDALEARLLSIGDHFDHDLDDPAGAGRESMRILRWLLASGATLMFGNHDAARVMELIGFDDDAWAEARAQAVQGVRVPALATAGLATRDYASYIAAQRQIVVDLLLAGRFELARAAALPDGRAVLLTHAGVTLRELTLLGIPDERDPVVIAKALQAFFHAAIDRVRGDWLRAVWTPLSLEPLHVAGADGEEGGGLLYHRPASPLREGADPAWELAAARPRRFDPRTLPRGMTQVCGHTGHAKALKELGTWPTLAARARPHGGIRTLRVEGERVTYEPGVLDGKTGVADLIMIDGEMRHVDATEYALLELRG